MTIATLPRISLFSVERYICTLELNSAQGLPSLIHSFLFTYFSRSLIYYWDSSVRFALDSFFIPFPPKKQTLSSRQPGSIHISQKIHFFFSFFFVCLSFTDTEPPD